MTLAVNWNTDLNFWLLNTPMKTVGVFNQFYKSDKSKNKETSSKIMWAIALLIDPNDANPWKNVNPQDKKDLIVNDFLNLKEFNWDNYTELIDVYKERCLTVAQKSLVELEDKLSERARFISNTKYTLDQYDDNGKVLKGTATQLDKMMVETIKIYQNLKQIKDQIIAESVDSIGRAGSVESASEQGLL